VITKKGEVKLGNLSCGMCHTRVMNDGSILKGAQGNFPGDLTTAHALQNAPERVTQFVTRALFAAPWVKDDPHSLLASSSKEAIIKAYAAVPEGANGRQGTSILFPPQVPDLIGVKDRKYFDHGGLGRHRDIGDMMRYIAINQALDFLNSYDGYIPIGQNEKVLPEPGKARRGFAADDRYSEEQLYALAKFVYSLTPPVNPNKSSAITERGKTIFIKEGCVTCHTPPVFTNNKLTPADGFEVPEDHWDKYDIFGVSVGTDPNYTLTTRRGTGYYKIPSLRGVWYRGPFFHNAWLATLEDVFDPRRLKEDYTPTAFKSGEKQAVRGHEFGLTLSEKDRKALIAYLRTL
jgi:cytochrome c2